MEVAYRFSMLELEPAASLAGELPGPACPEVSADQRRNKNEG